MPRPTKVITTTATSTAVRVSVGFVIITAAVVGLLGAAAILHRLLSS